MKTVFYFFSMTIATLATISFAGNANADQDNHYAIYGFSADGSLFIFEEFGEHEYVCCGSSEIFFIDIKKNDWISGTPITTEHYDDPNRPVQTIIEIREENRNKAKRYLENFGPLRPVQVLYKNPDVGYTAKSVRIISLQIDWQTTLEIDINQIELPHPQEFTGYIFDKCYGYAVKINQRQVYQDEKIPLSRRCPLSYSIDSVVTDGTTLMMVLSYLTPDMEADHDRNYIAVPLK